MTCLNLSKLVQNELKLPSGRQIINCKPLASFIPNGCFDAYEVKVNQDIFKYQEKVKLISHFSMAY